MDRNDARVYVDADSGRPSYRDDDDVKFEWDDERSGWIPVLDALAVEQQQSVYADPQLAVHEQTVLPPSLKRKVLATHLEKSAKPKSARNKVLVNTSVYISGLPADMAPEELIEMFGKYGLIMEDIVTGAPKIKLYRDTNGDFKGDALVTYVKPESVSLASTMMDEGLFRPDGNCRIKVQQAEFKPKTKEELAEAAASRLRADKRTIQQKLKKIDKKLDWVEPVVSAAKLARNAKIVVLKHMFTHQELEKDPTAILDIKADIREECEKVGEITNLILYDLEEDGIVTIRFKDERSTLACIKLMSGRNFGGQQVVAELFDGHTKYQKSKRDTSLEGVDDEEKRRLNAYEGWLESNGTSEQ